MFLTVAPSIRKIYVFLQSNLLKNLNQHEVFKDQFEQYNKNQIFITYYKYLLNTFFEKVTVQVFIFTFFCLQNVLPSIKYYLKYRFCSS